MVEPILFSRGYSQGFFYALEIFHWRDDRLPVADFSTTRLGTKEQKSVPSKNGSKVFIWGLRARMSLEVSNWLVNGCKWVITPICSIYKEVITHLLTIYQLPGTSWDIQERFSPT